jgi:DNA polymerase-3 subunit delta
MFPLMGEHKCVCVTDMSFEKLTAEDFESLCNLIQDVPDFTTLVFYALSNELDTKKEKTKTIVNLISKNGCELDFTVKEAKKQSLQFINALAKEKGIKISSANSRVISEKACGDFSVIETELEKLSNYKNGGEITTEDIEKVFSLYLDTTVFELSRYVLSNNLEASLKILAEIKQQKEEPIAVLAGLSSNFIDLYRANAAKNKGITLETATEDFQYKSSVYFRIQNAFRDCSRYSDKFIKTCIEKMSQTDILLKTTGTDGYTLLEQLIIDIFVARERVGN